MREQDLVLEIGVVSLRKKWSQWNTVMRKEFQDLIAIVLKNLEWMMLPYPSATLSKRRPE